MSVYVTKDFILINHKRFFYFSNEFYLLLLKFSIDATFPYITNLNKINLKVTHRVTHQIVSRIYAIFLKEIINYNEEIEFQSIDDDWSKAYSYPENVYEWNVIYQLQFAHDETIPSMNLEVWRTPDQLYKIPHAVNEGNALSKEDIARYGLYIPKDLKPIGKFSYENFISTDGSYKRTEILFRLNDQANYLQTLKTENINTQDGKVKNGVFIPHHCHSDAEPCAVVLTSHFIDTSFIVRHIELLKLKMKVYFLSDNLKESIRNLSQIITNLSKTRRNTPRQLFLVLHWTPSEIIDGSDQFDEVVMPKCELYKTPETSCKYEANLVSIYFNDHITNENLGMKNMMENIQFQSLKPIIKIYENYYSRIEKIRRYNSLSDELKGISDQGETVDDVYNDIACQWLKENNQVYEIDSQKKWYNLMGNTQITISGM